MCENYELGNIIILGYKWHIFIKTAMNETMWMFISQTHIIKLTVQATIGAHFIDMNYLRSQRG